MTDAKSDTAEGNPSDQPFGTLRPDPRRKSFAQMPEELLLDRRLSDRAKVLWGVLDRQAKGREVAIDSRKKLAGKIGCSSAALDRALAELVKIGWVGREVVPGRVSRYTLYDEPTLITSDDTPNGGVITGDETPSSPVTRHTRAIPSREVSEERELPAPATASATPGRRPDEIWDTVLDVCGIPADQITPSRRGAYIRAVADLRAVAATPDEIRTRAHRYTHHSPGIRISPNRLASVWAELSHDTTTHRPTGQGRAAPSPQNVSRQAGNGLAARAADIFA